METTRQEIIDQVRARLSDGRGRAFDGDSCFYRRIDGTPCAVGCLFTDAEYTPEMEDRRVIDLNAWDMLPARLVPHLDLLTKLQRLHDYAGNWDGNRFVGWEEFDQIAKEPPGQDYAGDPKGNPTAPLPAA